VGLFALLYIGVVPHLILDGRRISMSGIYDGVGWEGKQLLLYGADELSVVAVCKVGAPDGALKKGVAREEQMALGGIEAGAAG
jgi:hypothetical protein